MRISIVVAEELGVGFIANATACIASGLFHLEQNIIGSEIVGADFKYIPITKIPIMIFKRNKKEWIELLKRAKNNKLKYMVFTKEAQSTTNYDEYALRVKGKTLKEIQIIGIGVLGEDHLINSFSGDLALLR